jgi:hypothetical protein
MIKGELGLESWIVLAQTLTLPVSFAESVAYARTSTSCSHTVVRPQRRIPQQRLDCPLFPPRDRQRHPPRSEVKT